MGSDSPSLRLRRVLVVEALPDTDGRGPERLGVNRTSRRHPCPIRRRTPVNQSQPQLTFRRTQGKPPWSQDPPDTSSKLVSRQTLLGRSTSRLRETGHGGGLVSGFVSVAFVRLRSPTLRSDPVMRAGPDVWPWKVMSRAIDVHHDQLGARTELTTTQTRARRRLTPSTAVSALCLVRS
jgi:hypothetical protein